MIIGQKLRELREENGLLLRQVAAHIEVDTAYISKMERGEKNIKKDFIYQLAELYKADLSNLLILWLADQIYDLVNAEPNAIDALEYVTQKLKSDN